MTTDQNGNPVPKKVKGEDWWKDEEVYDAKGYDEPSFENYLDYERKRFYLADYEVSGKTLKVTPYDALNRLYIELGTELYKLVREEGVWSQAVESALQEFAKRYSGYKAPAPDPVTLKVGAEGGI